jgi:hypothetical protein
MAAFRENIPMRFEDQQPAVSALPAWREQNKNMP